MTFSIVARDPQTGALGVATATAGPMVGVLVPHARSGVGAVATQAMTNPYLALDILAGLGDLDAGTALDAALADDGGRAQRQVIVVDGKGTSAGWTGAHCQGFAGHVLGEGVAVAGNILTGPQVLETMMDTFAATDGAFGQRLLAALAGGAAAGGDQRGIGSAALKVFETEAYAALDLRVDWSEEPMRELSRLFGMAIEGEYAQFHAALPRRFSHQQS
jgi:uncharacterized Ntn-hydrolase superfamily protein